MSAKRIEAGMDCTAAALYAGAAALVLSWLDATVVYTGASSAIAFVGGLYALRSVAPEIHAVALPDFAPVPIECVELAELQLTDDDRLQPAAEVQDDTLILDDILAGIDPDSRVVRLFDPGRMPGEQTARIGLGSGETGPPRAPADASATLHQALAELRRSLR